MCDFSKGFILCKCGDPKVIVHNKKSRRNKTKNVQNIEYVWTLHRYVGMSKQQEIGRYTLPVDDVGSGLTSDFVLSQLNKRNCFDFEYSPREGDNLAISGADWSSRIEFIHRDGKWEEDHYSPFDHDRSKINNGKIKPIEKSHVS